MKNYKVKKIFKSDVNQDFNDNSVNYNESLSKVAENHKGLVSCQYDINNITTIQWSTCTSKATHSNYISFDYNGLDSLINVLIPAIKMIESANLSRGFELIRASMVTRETQIKIDVKDIEPLKKDIIEYYNNAKSEVMRKFPRSSGDGQLVEVRGKPYFLHNDYIYKQGNIFLGMDFTKAIKITDPLILAMFSLDIVDDKHVKKFVDISDDVKTEIKMQYIDLLKSLSKIEKD